MECDGLLDLTYRMFLNSTSWCIILTLVWFVTEFLECLQMQIFSCMTIFCFTRKIWLNPKKSSQFWIFRNTTKFYLCMNDLFNLTLPCWINPISSFIIKPFLLFLLVKLKRWHCMNVTERNLVLLSSQPGGLRPIDEHRRNY